MALFREAVVERERWLDEQEFFEILTFAQILPGPNLVNLSAYLSHRLFGNFFVAVLGVLALTAPGALLGILLIANFDTGNPHAARWLQGVSLGSIAIFLIFLRRMYVTMRAPVAGVATDGKVSVPAHRRIDRRHGAQLLVALGVGVASFSGVPLYYSLGAGVATAWVVEFSGWFK